MTKPPSNKPVFFEVACDKSTIKQGKKGNYRLVMNDVELIYWKTKDLSEQGHYKPNKYAKNFKTFYGFSPKVKSYMSYMDEEGSENKARFTISKIKYKKKSKTFISQIESLNNNQADIITGIAGLEKTSTSIHTRQPSLWRPDWLPDGETLNLKGSYLSAALLDNAQLAGVNLSSANLSHAGLLEVDLMGANLRGANLSHSEILYTDMVKANLSKADLSDSVLIGTNLSDANLKGADLNGMLIDGVNLSGADLTGARDFNASTWRGVDWTDITCPDGSTNQGYYEYFDGIPYYFADPCSGDQLIPLT